MSGIQTPYEIAAGSDPGLSASHPEDAYDLAERARSAVGVMSMAETLRGPVSAMFWHATKGNTEELKILQYYAEHLAAVFERARDNQL